MLSAELIIYGLIFVGVLVLVEGVSLVAFGKSISLNSRVNRRLEMLEKTTSREEVLAKLRANSPKVDAAFQRAEMAAKQTVGSMLIKPVQRLCKYPLFFRELCALLPESRAEYPQLRLLADEMAAVNAEVNGKVLTDSLCA